MSNDTSSKKKWSIGKILLWILGIVVALQVISGGEFLEDVFESPSADDQSNPTSPTEIVYKAFIGLSGQDTADNTGVLITSVVAGSPAEKAGIQVGDIITAMNSRTISNSTDFKSAMALLDPQETVEVSLIRGGVSTILSVTIEEKAEVVTQPQEETPPPQETQNQATQPQNTTPPQSSTDVQTRYPSLPVELYDHVLLGTRKSGISSSLTGNVLITVIFVNDPTSTWTSDKIASTKASDNAMTAEILSEAASYGANLNITIEYRQATVTTTEEVDSKAWAEQIIANAGLGNIATASAELERTKGVQEAPILFYLNATERSYAMPSTGDYTEYAIIWNCGSDTVTYRHELYHLFGAPDFYMPQAVKEGAQRHFPNSTMLTEENAMTDELTAYFIGWTDTLTDKALTFLRETAHITPEDVAGEYEKETHTGYVENWEKYGEYITGYLDFGILEGPGKIVYKDGSWYEGNFVYGSYHGQGKLVNADGSWYDGVFENNNFVRGKCRIVYQDGGWYEGNMDRGAFNGQGTMVWPNGDTYTGQWKDSQYHGSGKLTCADGGWNEGVFENSAFISGQCKIIYQDGSRYEGAMDQGTLNGQGTMIWASGDTYTGQWKNGQYHGYRKLTYAGGGWYEGNFDCGLFSGQGTYTWSNGDRYTGSFANGKFHGYGTYTWANGNSRSGTWKDGNFVG